MHAITHFLVYVLGLDNEGGRWYAFWSGFGSDVSELSILGAVGVMVRKHQCHYPRCPRIGRFRVPDKPWVLCHKHHPDGAPTKAEIDSLSEG